MCVHIHPFLQTGLRYVFDAVILRNNEAMEALLHSSIELAIGRVAMFPCLTLLMVTVEQRSSEVVVPTKTGFLVQHPLSKPLLHHHPARQLRYY